MSGFPRPQVTQPSADAPGMDALVQPILFPHVTHLAGEQNKFLPTFSISAGDLLFSPDELENTPDFL